MSKNSDEILSVALKAKEQVDDLIVEASGDIKRPSEFAVIMGEDDNAISSKWPKYDPDPNNCGGHGQKKCLEEGRHSSFNHSMDGYYNNPGASNLPPGFTEPY